MSPTQYNWPAPQAGDNEYPSRSVAHKGTIELTWKADFGEGLARQWHSALRAWEIKPDSRLRILTSTKFEGALIHQSTRGVRIQAQLDPKPAVEPDLPLFSLVLFAMGLGEEKCTIDGHSGPRFWDEDSFDQERLGLPAKPRVLISGGGDGALQDFIRLLTGKRSALEVYESLEIPEPQRLKLEKSITWAEDHWQRSAVWSTKQWDCVLLRDLHRAYEAQVEELSEAFWTGLAGRIKLRVPDEFELRLIHSCDHFGRCYALNHFVALVLGKLLKLRGMDSILSGRRVTRIGSLGCDGKACQGRDHEVRSAASACDSRGGTETQHLDEGTFQVLVLRNWIEPPSPLGNAPSGQIRQMLPTHTPWAAKLVV